MAGVKDMKFGIKEWAAILLVAVVGVGCANIDEKRQSAGPGEATYRYERIKPDGTICRVWAASAREVSEAGLEVDLDCALRATGRGMTGAEAQLETLRLFRDLRND